jgi:hypothetical protein
MSILRFDHLPRCSGGCHGGDLPCDCSTGHAPSPLLPAEAATELLADEHPDDGYGLLVAALTALIGVAAAASVVAAAWPLVEYFLLLPS